MGFDKDERKERYIFYSLNLEEKLFERILEKIVAGVEHYPVLRLDLEKSGRKLY